MKYLVMFSIPGSRKIHKIFNFPSLVIERPLSFFKSFSKEYIYSFSYKNKPFEARYTFHKS